MIQLTFQKNPGDLSVYNVVVISIYISEIFGALTSKKLHILIVLTRMIA